MALLSDRNETSRNYETTGIGVVRVIAMKESLGLVHSPGVVVILDSFRHARPKDLVGKVATIRTPDGSRLVTIEAVRDHVETISLFFRGLSVGNVPNGARIELEG